MPKQSEGENATLETCQMGGWHAGPSELQRGTFNPHVFKSISGIGGAWRIEATMELFSDVSQRREREVA